jgi:epoxide hydrolase-like predicted phosphatase
MAIKAIIWDLGGVLVRTEDKTPRQVLAKKLGLTYAELEKFVFAGDSGGHTQLGQCSLADHWKKVQQNLNLTDSEMDEFQSLFWGGDQLDLSLVEFIRSQHQTYKTSLLSNHFPDLRKRVLHDWKFGDAFDDMVISSEVGLVKPDPRIYQLALARLGVSAEQAFFVDDNRYNLSGARFIGMNTVHFQNAQQVKSIFAKVLNGHNMESVV